MRTAYLDCFSGVSGDMLLGALLDVGLPEAHLRAVVSALQLDGVTLEISRPVVQGFAATSVQVHVHHHEHDHAHRHLARESPASGHQRSRPTRVPQVPGALGR